MTSFSAVFVFLTPKSINNDHPTSVKCHQSAPTETGMKTGMMPKTGTKTGMDHRDPNETLV
jgi:hypothetical protein